MVLSWNGESVFALGMYEQPRTVDEWRKWSEAGINLVRCSSSDHLDRVSEWGMFGWVPVPLVLARGDDGSALAGMAEELCDHPALAVWEGPDEVIWHAWRLTPGKPTRFWQLPPDKAAELHRKMDEVIEGYERGVAVLRETDPHRKVWQNEACQSDQDSLARCLPFLDIIGFDYYPIPEDRGRPMNLMGRYVDRFRSTGPTKGLWVVQQAFSWSSLEHEGDRTKPVAYPSVDEYRFMAWQAIAHGATGLLWWGSHAEDRPAPHLDDLMRVVAELKDLHPFLAAGVISGVQTVQDTKRFPPILGVSCILRRAGGRTLLALVNEDPFPADAMLVGLDWADPRAMRPVNEPSSPITRVSDGYVTPMNGYEVRIYVTE